MDAAMPSFKKDFGSALLMNFKTGKHRVVKTLLVNNRDKGPGQKKAKQLVINWCPWCKAPLTDEAKAAIRSERKPKEAGR
jgi:hypothetical protein